MSHLLVTNDFPPKVGGIQSYLWELWRRLPKGEATVVTTRWRGAERFDAAQPFSVLRTNHRALLPTPAMASEVRRLVCQFRPTAVVLDPALPLGVLGPRLGVPYAVVVHGAEITAPARVPLLRTVLASTLRSSAAVIAAGEYPAAVAARCVGGADRLASVTVIPPGVDMARFRVLGADERAKARSELELPIDGRLVVSVSRLVPRKGMDVLIDAAALLAPGRPDLTVAIAGAGRDAARLSRRIRQRRAPVRMLGRVGEDVLPQLYGCADVFAMLCRDRWAGLEQEGFGIVFLEAAACGVPQVAGASGGSAEAVVDGETGRVVANPADPGDVAAALASLLDDAALRRRQGEAARQRAETEFSYDRLAARLSAALSALSS